MKIYGHCGAQAYAPENTLESFELSFKMGSHGIENDIRMTLDGEIVVIHDADTELRYGKKLVIEESTLAQLKELVAIDRFEGKYPGVRIPTLDQTYELMKKYPNTVIDVELKASGEAFLKKVLEVTEKHAMKDRAFYSTFEVPNLEWLHANAPHIPTAYLTVEGEIEPALKNGCVAVHPHFRSVDAEYVKRAHAAGLEVNVWTADAPEHILKMIEYGVDGIITNKPDVALELLKNK